MNTQSDFHSEGTLKPPVLAFGIVTYKERYYDTIAFKSLMSSLLLFDTNAETTIYIYDNTDSPDWKVDHQNFTGKYAVSYFADQGNSGISVAYNFMANKALNAGYTWIAFLDQDTNLSDNAVEQYSLAINTTPDRPIKVPVLEANGDIFSPSYIFFNRSFPLKRLATGIKSLRFHGFVNSGMLVRLDFFFKVGGYNEKLKLDFTDFDFIKRLRPWCSFFEVLPLRYQHEFSHNEKDILKALARYRIFVRDLQHCTRNGVFDSLGYSLVGYLHMAKLTMKFKSMKFIQVKYHSK